MCLLRRHYSWWVLGVSLGVCCWATRVEAHGQHRPPHHGPCKELFLQPGFGTCVAFCEALECDEHPRRACDVLRRVFFRRTGMSVFPCEDDVTPSPTPTFTPTGTPAGTASATATATAPPTPSMTSPPATDTVTPTITATGIPTGTAAATATETPTPAATATPTDTASELPSQTPTGIPTGTAAATATETPTETATAPPSETPTGVPTGTAAVTATATAIPSSTDTATPTVTAIPTGTSAATVTPTVGAPLPGACDEFNGAGFGLCSAYCALDCDLGGTGRSCRVLLRLFEHATGEDGVSCQRPPQACSSFSGSLRRLCERYCDRCDDDDAPSRSCERLERRFNRKSEVPLQCAG